jgi:polar amino acid transport system substrate-binding protein
MPGRRGVMLLSLALLLGFASVLVLADRRVRDEAESERRWALVRARGGLRVGIDPSDRQFSYFTADGWQGFDADLARDIARRLGLALWVEPVGYDGLYDALKTDRVDVAMSALIPDPAQTAEVTYSAPYFEAGLALVGGCRARDPIPACLSGQRVSVALGSDADRLVRLWQRRASDLSRIPADDEVAALALFSARADASLVDSREVWKQLALLRDSDTPLAMVESRPYVLAARRGDGRLVAEVNALLGAMRADGTLDGLARKWLAPR